MARLNSPRRILLSEEDFKIHPVWTWDDEHEGYLPISEREPSPDNYDILLIKAQFITNDHVFQGYLVRALLDNSSLREFRSSLAACGSLR